MQLKSGVPFAEFLKELNEFLESFEAWKKSVEKRLGRTERTLEEEFEAWSKSGGEEDGSD